MYHILDKGVEIAETTCPNSAVALAMQAAKASGDESVTVENRSVWGRYADPALVGKPYVAEYDWQRAKRSLMG